MSGKRRSKYAAKLAAQGRTETMPTLEDLRKRQGWPGYETDLAPPPRRRRTPGRGAQ